MILSDKSILSSIESGEIVIEPFDLSCLGTNSYDVHLGKHLAIYKDHILDARKHNEIEHLEIPEHGFVPYTLASPKNTRKPIIQYLFWKENPVLVA
jgi:dCTP deaminase